MIYCDEDETKQHLLMDCDRVQGLWTQLKGLGIMFMLRYNPVSCELLEERPPSKHKALLQWMYRVLKTAEGQMLHADTTDDTVINEILADFGKKLINQNKALLMRKTSRRSHIHSF